MTLKLSQPSCFPAGRVIVSGADPQHVQRLEELLGPCGFEVAAVERPDQVVADLLKTPAEVCLVDVAIDDATVHTLLCDLQKQHLGTQVVQIVDGPLAAGQSSQRCDILERPHTPTALAQAVRSAAARAKLLCENSRLKQRIDRLRANQTFSRSAAMQRLMEKVREAADGDAPVLIQGEAGCDSAQLAQTLHLLSARQQRPCIRLECSVLSADCLLRELFGSPATLSRPGALSQGRLRIAEGGTLVLAGIDSIVLPLQRKLAELLRNSHALQHYLPEGSREPRLIATTHADLQSLVRAGAFDAELCALLSQTSLTLVPLRERKEDLASLTETALAETAIREGRPRKRLTVEALELLEHHTWPGNLHELRNVVDRACALDASQWLTADMIRPWISALQLDGPAHCGLTLKDMERKLIETTFARCGGNRERTAQSLQIGVRTLSGKLREYGYPPRGAPGSNLLPLERKAA